MQVVTKYLKLKVAKTTPCLKDLNVFFTNHQPVDMRYIEEKLSKKKTKKYVLITFNNENEAQFAYNQLQLTQCKGYKLFFQYGTCSELDIVWDINLMTAKQSISNNKLSFLHTVKHNISWYWRVSQKPFIITICGPSGCGKSTLCKSLCSFLNFMEEKINPFTIHSDSHFATKHCYLDKELGTRNMEQKEACDYDAILRKIKVSKAPIIVMEGLMLINNLEILNQSDILILIDCDKNICFERRKSRRKRNNIKGFTTYYNRYVAPEYIKNSNYFWSNTVHKLQHNQLFININASNKNAYEVLLNIIKHLFDCAILRYLLLNDGNNITKRCLVL